MHPRGCDPEHERARLKPQIGIVLQATGVERYVDHPFHNDFYGDVTFALSLGEAQADITALGVAGAEALAQAILRAVRNAATLSGVPGLAG
jgi:L-aminopeptidase/D-esterase-like protein